MPGAADGRRPFCESDGPQPPRRAPGGYARAVRVGIDLGTTRTVIASAEDGRHPVAAFEIEGGWRDWLPGVVIERGGSPSFGWRAVRDASAADAVIRSLKRAVSTRAPDEPVAELSSRPSAIELLSGFASHVVAEIGSSTLARGPVEPASTSRR